MTPAANAGLASRAAAVVEAFFVRYRAQLVWVHIAAFFCFLAIMVIPLLLPDPPDDSTPFTHFTTFANYVLWGL